MLELARIKMNVLSQSKPKIKFSGLDRVTWKKKLANDLTHIPGFKMAFFYGSFARRDDGPWSDVELIGVLESSTKHEIAYQPELYWERMMLVSDYLKGYPDIEAIVYSEKEWKDILSDPHPIGFWKEVRREMVNMADCDAA